MKHVNTKKDIYQAGCNVWESLNVQVKYNEACPKNEPVVEILGQCKHKFV